MKMVLQSCLKSLFIFVLLILHLAVFKVHAQDTPKRPTVGLVLSGGGAKGLAHIGVLKVLEEVGMPVDYVGGTSMGSIVAGFYAIGYSAEEIEKEVSGRDWIALLTDQINRENLSVPEKQDYDRYLFSLAIDNWKLKIPSGLGAGQNVSLLLSRLAEPVAHISDFNDLPRPFLCVAMDIVTGKEVVLRNGYLPDAIRASMAIPSVFTPVEIGDHYLVDGGLVNNFPVDHVKAMGADIVIGVNLGLKQYNKKDLENLAAVLEQSLFFQAKDRNKQNQKLCDVLLAPDVYSSNAVSFNDVAGLIATGENVARERYDELKNLADSINALQYINKDITVIRNDSLLVKDIVYTGLKNVTSHYLNGKLRIKPPVNIAIDDVEAAIDRAMGTQFFNRITYKTEEAGRDSVILVFRIKEKTNELLRFGFQYDNVFKAQMLLNFTVRNKLIKGSKLTADLHLGIAPKLDIEYRFNTGWSKRGNPLLSKKSGYGLSPDIGLAAYYNYFELNNYSDNHELISNYAYEYVVARAFISTSVGNPLYLEGGIDYEYSFLKTIFASEESPLTNHSTDLYGMIIYDSQDDQVLPSEGSFVRIFGDMSNDFNYSNSGNFIDLYRVGLLARKVLPIGQHIGVQPFFKTGFCFADSIPPLKSMIIGGHQLETDRMLNMYSFPGFRAMESRDKEFYSLGLDLRVRFFEKHYFSAVGAYGNQSESVYHIINDFSNPIIGMGFKYSYKTIIGPLVIGAFKSNQGIPWLYTLTIGYWL